MKMKNIKKIASCILSTILLFGAVACGGKEIEAIDYFIAKKIFTFKKFGVISFC